jgi:patatin-like phospholipase/acyl hydrolase
MSLLLLRRIEEAQPGFLAATQLFAGTSAGGISAVIVAAANTPLHGIDNAIRFWEGFPAILRRSRRFLSGLAGTGPLYSHDRLRSALFEILGPVRLGEIERKVLVASMQLDSGDRDPERRSWRPRALSNLAVDHGAYLDDLLVDIAMRSAAAPVMWPVFQGFVDGGMFANDPSMLALTRVLEERRDRSTPRGHARDVLETVRLLSVGEGSIPHHLTLQNATWGYREWLLHRGTPLALVELALNSSGEAISEQCSTLLGDRQYFRLNPDVRFPGGRGVPDLHPASSARHGLQWILGAAEELLNPVHAQLERARTVGTGYDLGPALTWLQESDWIEAQSPSP